MIQAGEWQLYDHAKFNLGLGVFNLAADEIRCALFRASSNAGKTDGPQTLADLRGEVSVAGYVGGGNPLTGVRFAESTGGATFTADPIEWKAIGAPLPAAYAVLYASGDHGSETDPLLAVCQLDANGGEITTPDGETLTITPHADGIFSLASESEAAEVGE